MNTTTAKNAQISALILAQMAKGLELPQAFDAVFGAGAYMKLASDVYNQLRAKTK